jgi:hypothetical protein
MMTSNPYRGFRYLAEVIHCFSLNLRGLETILAACGLVVSYETIREWGLRFGRLFIRVQGKLPYLGRGYEAIRCAHQHARRLLLAG